MTHIYGPINFQILPLEVSMCPPSPASFENVTENDIKNMSNEELADFVRYGGWGGDQFPEDLQKIVVREQNERGMYCRSPYLNPIDMHRMFGEQPSHKAYLARFSDDEGITPIKCSLCEGQYSDDFLCLEYNRLTYIRNIYCNYCYHATIPSDYIDPCERLNVTCDSHTCSGTKLTCKYGWFHNDKTNEDICQICYNRNLIDSCIENKHIGLKTLICSSMTGKYPFIAKVILSQYASHSVIDYYRIDDPSSLGAKYQHQNRLISAKCDDCSQPIYLGDWVHEINSEVDYHSECLRKNDIAYGLKILLASTVGNVSMINTLAIISKPPDKWIWEREYTMSRFSGINHKLYNRNFINIISMEDLGRDTKMYIDDECLSPRSKACITYNEGKYHRRSLGYDNDDDDDESEDVWSMEVLEFLNKRRRSKCLYRKDGEVSSDGCSDCRTAIEDTDSSSCLDVYR